MINQSLQLARRSGTGAAVPDSTIFYIWWAPGEGWFPNISCSFYQVPGQRSQGKGQEGKTKEKRKRREASVPGERCSVLSRHMRPTSAPEVPRATWTLYLAGDPSTLPALLPSPGSFFTMDIKELSVQQCKQSFLLYSEEIPIGKSPNLTLAGVDGGEFWNLNPGSNAHTKQFPALKPRDQAFWWKPQGEGSLCGDNVLFQGSAWGTLGGRKSWGSLLAHLPPSLPQEYLCVYVPGAGLLWTMFI